MKCVDGTEDPMLYDDLNIPSNKALNKTITMKKRNTEAVPNASKTSDDYQSKAKDPSKYNIITCLLICKSFFIASYAALGKSCAKDDDCANIDNSFCYGSCRCKKGFSTDITKDQCTVGRIFNTKSVLVLISNINYLTAELGLSTTNPDNCQLFRNSEYRDGKCLCKIGYSYGPSHGECIKRKFIIS